MLISVIVPTYNRANTIEYTLDSILAQTYQNLEIIIIDDGSTDETETIVKSSYHNKKIPIQYYQKSNGGCASARNQGLEYAKGEFIAFLDSDDRWMPNALETLLNCLVESQADFAYSPSIEVLQSGREKISYPCAKGCPEKFSIEHFKSSKSRPGAILYRRLVFEQVKGFREDLKYSEDSDFLQRVAIHFTSVYSSIPSVKVYHHAGNKSNNRIGIYSAMLKSSESILQEFPEFKKSLGNIADKRIKEIKINLIKISILSGYFTEAKQLEKDIANYFLPGIKFSLLLKSKIPLVIEKGLLLPVHCFNKLYIKLQEKLV
jgi:glycosyltransferase involved in cell wall biosynthesis